MNAMHEMHMNVNFNLSYASNNGVPYLAIDLTATLGLFKKTTSVESTNETSTPHTKDFKSYTSRVQYSNEDTDPFMGRKVQ